MLSTLFKAPWIWMAGAMCLLVLLGVILPRRDPGDHVHVALVGFTNQAGQKVALFRGSNDSKRALTYELDVKTNFSGPFSPKILLTVRKGGPISPGQSFTFSMEAPVETADWQPVFSYRLGWTKPEQTRTLVAELFYKVGLEELAQKIVPPTPEGWIFMNSSQTPERWLTHLEIGD